MRKAISGVLTAIVTPFTAEGALNLPALRQQVQRQLAAGNGIFCGGTNGEFFVLNEEEKIAVAGKVKALMQMGKKWREKSEKKNPAKDNDHQDTLKVMGWLDGK